MTRRSTTGGNAGHGMHWIRDTTRRRIYWRDGFTCVWCGATRNLCLDHIVPRSKGGTNAPSNLVTSCLRCNEWRGDMAAITFAFWLTDFDRAPWILDRVIERMATALPKIDRRR